MEVRNLYIYSFFQMLVLYFLWMSFYGGLILIFHHGDNYLLANPKIPTWLQVIDEIILAMNFILSVLIYKLNFIDKKSKRKLRFLLCFIIAPLCILAISQLYMYFNSLDFKFIKLCKNSISAALIVYLLITIHSLNLFEKLKKYLLFILSLSVLAGLIHYCIFPYEVYGNRVFGTFSNPNVTGLVCFFGITLGHYCLTKGIPFANFSILIFAIGAYASGSFTIFIILFFYLVSLLILYCIYKFYLRVNERNCRIALLTFLITVSGFFFGSNVFNLDGKSEVVQKAFSTSKFFSDSKNLSSNNSFEDRLILLGRLKDQLSSPESHNSFYIQSDSSIFNLSINYPIILFYILLATFICCSYLIFSKNYNMLIYPFRYPLAYFVFFSILPFSFVQYSLEEIPAIVLFYFAYTSLAVSSFKAWQGEMI